MHHRFLLFAIKQVLVCPFAFIKSLPNKVRLRHFFLWVKYSSMLNLFLCVHARIWLRLRARYLFSPLLFSFDHLELSILHLHV